MIFFFQHALTVPHPAKQVRIRNRVSKDEDQTEGHGKQRPGIGKQLSRILKVLIHQPALQHHDQRIENTGGPSKYQRFLKQELIRVTHLFGPFQHFIRSIKNLPVCAAALKLPSGGFAAFPKFARIPGISPGQYGGLRCQHRHITALFRLTQAALHAGCANAFRVPALQGQLFQILTQRVCLPGRKCPPDVFCLFHKAASFRFHPLFSLFITVPYFHWHE